MSGFKFNFNEVKESIGAIVPQLNGVEVSLLHFPKYVETDKGNRLEFGFVDDTDAQFKKNMLDPYQVDMTRYGTDEAYTKIVNGNFARLLHIFGAFVPEEHYQLLKDIDAGNLKEYIEKVSKLYAPTLLEEKFTILIGYKESGYLDFPTVGDCISSRFKPKNLLWNPKMKLSLTPVAKATPDKEVTAPSDDEL